MLSITNIAKTYKNGVQALRQIHLEIDKGMFGLLGPNGAGKSTLMRTIATLQAPDQGHILFNGVDIVKHPQAMRETLGYLPQEFGVYPKISAYKLLNHLGLLKGLLNKKARHLHVMMLLEQTNLLDVRHKAVSSFSGGMRQRFGIAQALLGNPKIIIVDEPTAGLDPHERARFLNLLSEVGEDIVVILSTHIVEDVSELCNHVAILNAGMVERTGTPGGMVEALADQIWQKTIAKSQLAVLEECHQVLSKRLKGGKPQVRILSPTQPDLGFEQVPPNLEDVYFATLVKRGRS